MGPSLIFGHGQIISKFAPLRQVSPGFAPGTIHPQASKPGVFWKFYKRGSVYRKLLNRFLLVPFISIFVLPIPWFEGRLLPKSGRISLAGALTLFNALVLYVPWAIAIIATRHLRINPVAVVGFFMIAVGFIVLATSLFPILRVPGQTRSLPESLVVEGPYRYVPASHLFEPLLVGCWRRSGLWNT